MAFRPTAMGTLIASLFLPACTDARTPTDFSPASRTQLAPLYTASPTTQAFIIPDEYVVRLRDDVADPAAEARRIVSQTGGEVHYVYRTLFKGFRATLPSASLESVRRGPTVAFVTSDTRDAPATTQTNAGWALGRIDQRFLPDDNSFTYHFSGTNVHIYILDSGVTPLAAFGTRYGQGYGVDGTNHTVDCEDHGTKVAAAAAHATHGSAKNAIIHSVRVVNASCEGSRGRQCEGLDWVASHQGLAGAIANMSRQVSPFPWPLTNCLETAVPTLVNTYGVALITAAGNNNGQNACDWLPPKISEAFTVAATTVTDTRASFSNIGTCVDLFAPGQSVPTVDKNGNAYAASGTSFASPLVAGVGAMILQQDVFASPSLIRQILTATATSGVVQNAGSGSPNLFLYSLHPYMYIDGPGVITTPGSYTWSAKRWGGTGSYTYLWERSDDGQTSYVVGTGPSYAINNITQGDCYSFWLDLTVDFGGGEVQTKTKYVQVIVPECPQ